MNTDRKWFIDRRPSALIGGFYLNLLRRFRSEEVGRGHRNLPEADTRGIVDGITDGGGHQRDHSLSGAGGRYLKVVDQDRVDLWNRVAELKDRVTVPVVGRHGSSSDTTFSQVAEFHFFQQRAARSLDHLTLHLVAETIGIDHWT